MHVLARLLKDACGPGHVTGVCEGDLTLAGRAGAVQVEVWSGGLVWSEAFDEDGAGPL